MTTQTSCPCPRCFNCCCCQVEGLDPAGCVNADEGICTCSCKEDSMVTKCDAMKALAANRAAFLTWAETAEGCDWCCGGGDQWSEDLDEALKALGFETWDAFEAAYVEVVGEPLPQSEPAEDEDADEYDDSMDGDAESALASAGWGTDEDYGCFDGGDDF